MLAQPLKRKDFLSGWQHAAHDRLLIDDCIWHFCLLIANKYKDGGAACKRMLTNSTSPHWCKGSVTSHMLPNYVFALPLHAERNAHRASHTLHFCLNSKQMRKSAPFHSGGEGTQAHKSSYRTLHHTTLHTTPHHTHTAHNIHTLQSSESVLSPV